MLLGGFYVLSAAFMIVPLGWVFADSAYPVICNVAVVAAMVAPIVARVRLSRHGTWDDHLPEVSLMLFVVLILLGICGSRFS